MGNKLQKHLLKAAGTLCSGFIRWCAGPSQLAVNHGIQRGGRGATAWLTMVQTR